MRLFQSVGPFKPMFWFSAKKTAVGRKCFLTESCQGTDIKGADPFKLEAYHQVSFGAEDRLVPGSWKETW